MSNCTIYRRVFNERVPSHCCLPRQQVWEGQAQPSGTISPNIEQDIEEDQAFVVVGVTSLPPMYRRAVS
jgi:hypothetical protein